MENSCFANLLVRVSSFALQSPAATRSGSETRKKCGVRSCEPSSGVKEKEPPPRTLSLFDGKTPRTLGGSCGRWSREYEAIKQALKEQRPLHSVRESLCVSPCTKEPGMRQPVQSAF